MSNFLSEPYICIKDELRTESMSGIPNNDYTRWKAGYMRSVGRIESCDTRFQKDCWMPYADFERQKFNQLDCYSILINAGNWDAFNIRCESRVYGSKNLINYEKKHYDADSESSRLLKRADFLKAVCEKEGVQWLPKLVTTMGADGTKQKCSCTINDKCWAAGRAEDACMCECHMFENTGTCKPHVDVMVYSCELYLSDGAKFCDPLCDRCRPFFENPCFEMAKIEYYSKGTKELEKELSAFYETMKKEMINLDKRWQGKFMNFQFIQHRNWTDLLFFLQIPNMGIVSGFHWSRKKFVAAFEDIKRRITDLI